MNPKNQRFLVTAAAFLTMAMLSACNPPASDQHLQEQAAQATENAKRQSQEALAQAKIAAANAERTVDDVAAGVKQGMQSKDGGPRLDLNDASEADLAGLPGISGAKARQIIEHRPYTSTHDLVKSGVLSEGQFDRVAPKVTVR